MLIMQNESKHVFSQNFKDNSRSIKFLFFYIENLDTLTTSNIFTLKYFLLSKCFFYKNLFESDELINYKPRYWAAKLIFSFFFALFLTLSKNKG